MSSGGSEARSRAIEIIWHLRARAARSARHPTPRGLLSSRTRRLLLAALVLPALVACSREPDRLAQGPQVPPAAAPTFDAPVPSQVAASSYWTPAPGTTWQWQLADFPVDQSIEAEVYDLDLFETDPETIAALHAAGRKVVCYLSAGSWEDWRPDAAAFPRDLIGNDYQGWPGESWLDVRRIDLLGPVMSTRLDLCRDKGFDAVEPDNMDGYTNDTGFAITYEDQLSYNLWLAAQAHSRGLSIGLKNDPEQVADLVSEFDWALVEDCYDQEWCDELAPFLQAGKAVLAAEYIDAVVDFQAACDELGPSGFSLILKLRELTAWRQACPP